MRCHCCDKELTEKEINWNDDLKSWELCTICLDVALDAAYTNGFQNDDGFVGVDVGEESADDRATWDYTEFLVSQPSWYLDEEGWSGD